MMQRYRFDNTSRKPEGPTGRYTRENAAPVHQPGPDQTARVPAHGSYGNLLFDQRWRSKRAEIMLRDGHCCVVCKEKTELQVHHRQYHFIQSSNAFRMPWAYPDHLMITLCKSCHQRGHSKFKVPTLTI